jgi:hypothetical protein
MKEKWGDKEGESGRKDDRGGREQGKYGSE